MSVIRRNFVTVIRDEILTHGNTLLRSSSNWSGRLLTLFSRYGACVSGRKTLLSGQCGLAGVEQQVEHSLCLGCLLLESTHSPQSLRVGRRKHFFPYFPKLQGLYTSSWEQVAVTHRMGQGCDKLYFASLSGTSLFVSVSPSLTNSSPAHVFSGQSLALLSLSSPVTHSAP